VPYLSASAVVWYGIVEFNVPHDTVWVISETGAYRGAISSVRTYGPSRLIISFDVFCVFF